MKLAFVCLDLSKGGAERVISTLANKLSETDEIIIYLLRKNAKINYKIEENVKIIRNKKNIYNFLSIRNELKSLNVDVIISFLAKSNIISAISLIHSNEKLVVSERNDPFQNPSSAVVRIIRNNLYKLDVIKGFVFQTKDAQNYFSNKIIEKSTIIYNPLPEELPDYVEKKNFDKVVNVGRLESQKNQSLLINSFAKIKKKNAYLEIFGEGSLLDDLKQETLNIKMDKRVHFKGVSNNVFDEIKDAGLFIMSSDYEGMSNALIEALALGIPVISTDHPIGGARELIVHGENGLLVPVGNQKKMTEEIDSILQNESLAIEMSKNAQTIRNKLNINKVVYEWKNYLTHINNKYN